MREAETGSKAAEIAARYVESIVAAAEESAGRLTEEARQQAEEIRAKARKDAERELEAARKDARQLREQTQRQIDGRVAAADEAATQVLEEARTLSSGLRQLGSTLQSQGERILRDVQAAHKRMQADLRVSLPDVDRPARRIGAAERRASSEEPTGSGATAEERAALERAASELLESPRRASRGRDNPFDDLDVPRWVER